VAASFPNSLTALRTASIATPWIRGVMVSWYRGITVSWLRGVVVSLLSVRTVFLTFGPSFFSDVTLFTGSVAAKGAGESLKKGESDNGFVLFSSSGGTGGGEAGFVKNKEAPSSSLVMLSMFSFFLVIFQKVLV
jgi:hypothetical protein